MNRFDRPRQALAIGLASLAGYVDAVGYLSADRYFVSFMSGNTTRLAVEAAQDWSRALMPALLIGGFVIGVAGGAALGILAGRWRKPAVVALVALLLLFAAGLQHAGTHDPLPTLPVPAMLLPFVLVLAMGAINNTFQRDGEVALGLTYMTGALVKLGQGLGAALVGQARTGWTAYLWLWSGLAGGAFCGAALFLQLGAAALWLAAGWASVASFVAYSLVLRETR